ncbi:MAG: SPOR domain-containing protein [Bacteroidota bacterium]
MSRLDIITIAIVVVCLAALGYLVYKIAGLYKSEEPATPLTEAYGNEDTPDEQTYTDWEDEVASTGDDVDLDDDELGSYADTDEADAADGSGSYSDDELDKGTGIAEESTSDYDEPAANTNSSSSSGSSSATAAASRSNSSGAYMVIAGQFRQRSNADSYASKLRGMGYNNTSVELFDRGSYAVVLVDRFDSYNAAKRLVDDLTGKGIDAIVSK